MSPFTEHDALQIARDARADLDGLDRLGAAGVLGRIGHRRLDRSGHADGRGLRRGTRPRAPFDVAAAGGAGRQQEALREEVEEEAARRGSLHGGFPNQDPGPPRSLQIGCPYRGRDRLHRSGAHGETEGLVASVPRDPLPVATRASRYVPEGARRVVVPATTFGDKPSRFPAGRGGRA